MCASLGRCFRHVQLGGGLGEDPGLGAEITSPHWPGNASRGSHTEREAQRSAASRTTHRCSVDCSDDVMDSTKDLSGQTDTLKVKSVIHGESPESSCVSMKSDRSMDPPLRFSSGAPCADVSQLHMKRSDSPEPSCVSMNSDWSMDKPIELKGEHTSTGLSQLHMKRSDSPELSCVSMNSDWSMDKPIELKGEHTSTGLSQLHMKRSDSPEPSCVSMKSDRSMDKPIELKGEHTSTGLSQLHMKRSDSPESSCVSMKSDWSMDKPIELKGEHTSTGLRQLHMKRSDSPEPSCVSMKSDASIDKPLYFKGEDASTGLSHSQHVEVQNTFKSNMLKKFQCLHEGTAKQGNPTLLNEIYTELYITESERGEINNEHEVRQIETASRRAETQETPIKCNDIFKALPGQDKAIRTVLTKGVAGIGKTVSVQKYIVDWTEGKANQDVHFIFPLPFRELNLMKHKNISLLNLLHQFFTDTKELRSTFLDDYKVIFIFDGLDECRLPLDFQNNYILCDVTESASMDVLLTNLIKGNLLPSALLWITSRPAAANQIPPECVDQLTDVRGFNDPQKDEYFRKRIKDERLANRIITHMKSSRSLYIMCHIPVFCWISATVLQRLLSEAESAEIPKTLTQMFTHFLIFQSKLKSQKYDGKCELDLQQARKSILSLGNLAFQQLEKGNLIFYEEDLRECGIDVREASVYSGVCNQIFREEFGLHLGKVFSFVHLSIQEFLAALFKFLQNKSRMSDFLKSEVDKALQSENGHLDLFLRFLLGLSLKSNQTILRDLLSQTGSSSDSKQEIVEYIKMKIRENPSPEKSINLFHCLNELNDHSLVQEVQTYVNRRDINRLSGVRLSPAQWSALVFVLLNSEEKLDQFNLRKYDPSHECLLRLLPVIKASRKAELMDCNLTEKSCSALASVLSSNSSSLRELYLSNNDLQDSGVKLLSDALKSPHCTLEILSFAACRFSGQCCESLSSVLQSSKSLRELDLSNNDLQDSGVKLLSDALKSPHCTLEILRIADCRFTGQCCESLSSVLQSFKSLRELDLSNNDLQDSGVKLLSDALKSPHCTLEILRFAACRFTGQCCESLSSVLQSSKSLRELDLSNNDLQDSGVKLLSDALKSPHCTLEILRFAACRFTGQCCESLSSVLQSSKSLRELDLSNNDLQDSGVKLLSDALKSPHCTLEILRFAACRFTDQCCESLSSVLQSSKSLRELDLSNNDLQDSGVNLLSDALKSPHCTLEILRFAACRFTDQCCESLSSVLQSSKSLRELDLSINDLQDSGVKLLSNALKSPHCTLEILRFAACKFTDQCCESLSSVLQSSKSLRELDLSNNNLQDSGVKLLSDALKSPHCTLEILRLSGCMVTEEGCCSVALALRSNLSRLKELVLSYNHPGESGVKLLNERLNDPNCTLDKLNVDHGGEFRITTGLHKYVCDLTLDSNTAHTELILSEGNRKVTHVRERQSYPDHPERFDEYRQVLCRESLTGRCYWETQWSGDGADISVSYKEISRKGVSRDCVFGFNVNSWSLRCSNNRFTVYHNNNITVMHPPSHDCKRVGVYVDCPAGTLSFYSVSDTHTLTHLDTLITTFTRPLYAGFTVYLDSSVCVCEIDHQRHTHTTG
ncbi:NACHT, LRR and PYD domains-containing protein 12-like [Xyrauchen texanus]|uniref:NACHT, LRR and PYD domains-containing protein 12-like n=1 Tax=Xyrauchen texanus TaxID=154827 RepID=UPI00224295E3|nr:NACHT, LRR and PYD domains-containing protein 12-like [Xyrauchen texanus]